MLIEQAYEAIVAQVLPGSQYLGFSPLNGGISAEMCLLHFLTPEKQFRKVVLRRFRRQHQDNRSAEAVHERDILRTLQQVPSLNTPQLLHFDASGTLFLEPFVVLSYIEGATEQAPADRASYLTQFAHQLAAIHAVTPASVDLSAIRKPAPALDELTRGPLTNALGDTRPIRALIASHTLAKATDPTLLHGDFWPGNVLWLNGEVVGVIDWEDAMLGDPLIDLAISQLDIVMLFGTDALDQFTTAYLKANPLDCSDLPYWQLCAGLRIGRVIGQDLEAWVNPSTESDTTHATAASQRASYQHLMDRAIAAL